MRLFAHCCLVAVRFSVLTHAVPCWCWSHCGRMPLFLRCPIHGKGHTSFPHQERFPVLHSVSFTLGSAPISPRPVLWHRHNFWLLDLYTAIISQRPQVTKQCEVEGEVAWANITLLLMCYSITEILYLQGLYCKGLGGPPPVRGGSSLLSPATSAPASVVLPRLRMLIGTSVIHWWFLQTSGSVKHFIISSFGKGSPQVLLLSLDLPSFVTVLALGQAWDLPHLASAHHVHYALLFIIFDLN